MIVLPSVLVFLISVLVYLLIKYYLSRQKLYEFASKLSGPISVPILGNALLFACKNEDIFDRIQALIDNYPQPTKFWLGPQLLVIFSDLKHVETILASTKITHKSQIYEILKPIAGEGLISASGRIWKDHRKIIQPMISLKLVRNSVPTIQKHVDILIGKLDKIMGTGHFDILEYYHKCCFDIVADVIHGVTTDAQNGNASKVIHSFEDFYDNFFGQLLKPWLYPNIIFNMTSYKTDRDVIMDNIDGFIYRIIDISKKRVDSKELSEEDEPIVDQITRHLIKYPDAMSRQHFRDHLFTLFAASEDTTTITLAMCCRCFGMYPEFQEKAAEEIRDVFGDIPREVTLEDLSKLKYLEMCLKDVLRLQTIAPYILRQSTETLIVGNYKIPANCEVMIPIFSIHRNPEQWEVPLHFYPDHFLPEATAKRHLYAYLPFSIGPRACIGKNFAMQTMKVFMANILQRYRFEADGKFPDIKFRTDISVRPKCGYKVKIFKRTWS